MANKDIVKFIKGARERGFEDYEIRTPLLKQGWSDKLVGEAFYSIDSEGKDKIWVLKLLFSLISVILLLNLTFHSLVYFDYLEDKKDNINLFSSLRNNFAPYRLYSTVAILIEFVILFIILMKFISYKKGLKLRKKVLDLRNFHSSRTTTDLDALYEVLKEKKKLSLSTIANTFNVSTALVYEWGKILENGRLAKIEYPRFKEPILTLMEEIDEQERD